MMGKIKFDFKIRDYQKEVIQSTVNLFSGQPTSKQKLDNTNSNESSVNNENEKLINSELLLSNLQTVQRSNHREHAPIEFSKTLDKIDYSIEMETGTGKTYVYLKTIVELFKIYDWKKFIIIVPSVAIREGIRTEFNRLRIEFETESKLSIGFREYKSDDLNSLEDFHRSNSLEIMLMTMQSFNSDSNVLNKLNYDLNIGKPIKLIQEVKPIIILDEPQKMGGEATQEKLAKFNALFTLRYSATHKELINPIYRYTPVDAYKDGYVKKIEVLSVFGNPYTDIQSYVEVTEINTDNQGNIYTRLKFYQDTPKGIKIINRKAKNDFDLFEVSNGMSEYRGYKIKGIDLNSKTIRFENNIILKENEISQNKDEIMAIQIKETIEAHFNKEIKLKKLGIKVLSLFFIDKVVNFRDYNASDGKGKILQWFEKAYRELTDMEEYAQFKEDNISNVIAYYFAEDKNKKIKDTTGITKTYDEPAYDLIMREKEKLISFDTSQRFIFSHSALREGWDNPNVFQICTLNESRSEVRKRQEIGRGLRLPVNQQGKRIKDSTINILTVVANESYESFALGLQREIESETNLTLTEPLVPANARARKKIHLQKKSLNHPEFKKLWDKINKKTSYSIELEDTLLVNTMIAKVKENKFHVEPLQINTTSTVINSYSDIEDKKVNKNKAVKTYHMERIPNVVKRIADNTGLTKKNVVRIIKGANIESYIMIQPDLFVKKLSILIKTYLPDLLKDGIKYEIIENTYDMSLFKDEIEIYEESPFLVTKLDATRTLYDVLQLDSKVEVTIAKELSANDNRIKFFIKLPSWFKVPTPAGNYNPDWAIVFVENNDEILYLVRESKYTSQEFNKELLRKEEQLKIEYSKKHFDLIKADYQVIQSFEDLISTNGNGVYPFNEGMEENISREDFIEKKLKPFKEIGFNFIAAKSLLGKEIEIYNITQDEFDLL